MKRLLLASFVVLLIVISACGTGDAPEAATSDIPEATTTEALEPVRIANRGDASEGHTPRTFAGSGTGLFTGDNLNPNFPAGAGIQILLTFDLPQDTKVPTAATLVSDNLTVRGDAFESLGTLETEPVSYENFGPPLFDLATTGPTTTCARQSSTAISCDVSAAAQQAVEDGADKVQLRVQFSTMSDNDGEQDLALFFLTDSNTNEPGIFTLELTYE